MKIIVRPLDDAADRESFRSGVEPLDSWLRRQAGQAQRRRLASVWIASTADRPEEVLGFYSLAAWQIAFEECPAPLRKGLPRYPVPVTLIARLAVSADRRGEGLGGILLLDALRRAWVASASVPAQAVVVHAKDERAVAFYRHHGFLPLSEQSLHLFLPMGTIHALFEGS